MKIAFGVCSLGIGHATRSLPVIKKLVDEGHEVVIISHDRALSLLKRELPDLKYYDVPDYPIQYTEKAHQFIPYIIANSHRIIKSMIEYHRVFLSLDSRENFDIIVSDSRYDIFNRFKPSFLIMHQLRIMLKSSVMRGGTMIYNSYMSKFFRKIIVPDFQNNSLSGQMSHNVRFIPNEKIEYVGPLSSFKNRNLDRDIDVLISISGPEPQRTLFEKIVLSQLEDINGHVIVTLGRPESIHSEEKNVEIYSFLPSEKREEIMNRAKVVISRSGYSTIMDLAVVGGKAGFVPTPGQPEQRYLAQHLKDMGITASMSQDQMNLRELVNDALKMKGFDGKHRVEESVERVLEVIL